jgi:LPS sulfotransferase NodH
VSDKSTKRTLEQTFRLVRKRALYRLRIFVEYHARRRSHEPIFVLATRRSGSNLLVSYLNSVPGAGFAEEILNSDMYYGVRRRSISKKAVLRHILHSVNHCPERLCGAKFLCVHMRRHSLNAADLRALFPAARFLVLYRRSLFDQFLSLKIAEQTGEWRWSESFRLPDALRVDPVEFEEYCRMIRGFYQQLLDDPSLSGRSLWVSYEDLAEDPRGVFERALFPFLGVPAVPVSSAMRKQNTARPDRLVENYGEIEPLLKEEWARQEVFEFA